MKACSVPVPTWEPLDSGVSVNLRGLSVASPTVAWASGVNGTIVRTTDGGTTWHELPKIKRELTISLPSPGWEFTKLLKANS